MSCEVCGMACCVCGWCTCDLCAEWASYEYQMVTVPGPGGVIFLCDGHEPTYRRFAGPLTEVNS